MNQKLAKRLRKVVIGDVIHSAWSNGHVMRRLTEYEIVRLNPHKPWDTLLVRKDTPRGVYKHLKRRLKKGEISAKELEFRATQGDAGVHGVPEVLPGSDTPGSDALSES